ncbi:hypothetical protein FRC02_007131 [Tulasnella sp. 418]|nr:hypothetical protein FRC02_007131 [Tulasnella sp. 418]
MDFEYERQDRDLGPGWTPFRDVIQRQRSQNSDTFSANPSLQQTHGFQSQAPGFGPSGTSPTISQPSSSGWAASGGFGSQPSISNAEYDLMDIDEGIHIST